MKKINEIFEAVEIAKSQKELRECIHRRLDESILDPPQKTPYPDWLIKDDKINPEIKKQLYSILRKFREHINFKFDIEKILLKGSILTPRRQDDSDMDFSVYTNMSKEQRDSIIELVPKDNRFTIDGKELPNPVDIFILADGEVTPDKNLDAIFDVGENKWEKKYQDYSFDIPMNYALEVCNFFVNGSVIAISNYQNDKVMYEFYKGLDPETQDISKEEKEKAISEQKNKLHADCDALAICLHMISAFRAEAYADDPTPLKISIELTNDNPHNSINEVLLKLMEKLGIRERLRKAYSECEKLLEDDVPHEEEKIAAENESPKEEQ